MSIITQRRNKNSSREYTCCITDIMDEHRIGNSEYGRSYICKFYSNITKTIHYGLRFPGATRGGFKLNDNGEIYDIYLNARGREIYKEELEERLKEFNGEKIIFE